MTQAQFDATKALQVLRRGNITFVSDEATIDTTVPGGGTGGGTGIGNAVAILSAKDYFSGNDPVVEESFNVTIRVKAAAALSSSGTFQLVRDPASSAVQGVNYQGAHGFSSDNGNTYTTLNIGDTTTVPAGVTEWLLSFNTILTPSFDTANLILHLANFSGGLADPNNKGVISITINSNANQQNTTSPYMLGVSHHMHQSYDNGTINQVAPLLSAGGFNAIRDDVEWDDIQTSVGGAFSYANGNIGKYQKYGGPTTPTVLTAADPFFTSSAFTQVIILGYENNNYWNLSTQDITVNPGQAGSRYQIFKAGFLLYVAEMLAKFTYAKIFEVWNEWQWNFHLDPFSQAALRNSDIAARLFKDVRTYILTQRPNAIVVPSSFTDTPVVAGTPRPYGQDYLWAIKFCTDYVALGGSLSDIKYLNLHPYADYTTNDTIPERLVYGVLCGETWLRSEVSGYTASNIAIIATECGIPNNTSSGATISLQSQAEQMQRFIALFRAVKMGSKQLVKGQWIYNLANKTTGNAREDTLGLVNTNLSHKPVFDYVAAIAHMVRTAVSADIVHADTYFATPVTYANRTNDQWLLKTPTDWWAVKFTDWTDPADGQRKTVHMVWSPTGTKQVTALSANTLKFKTDFTGAATDKTSPFTFTATTKPCFLIQPYGQTSTLS